jgi:hypothetical protein
MLLNLAGSVGFLILTGWQFSSMLHHPFEKGEEEHHTYAEGVDLHLIFFHLQYLASTRVLLIIIIIIHIFDSELNHGFHCLL